MQKDMIIRRLFSIDLCPDSSRRVVGAFPGIVQFFAALKIIASKAINGDAAGKTAAAA